MSKTIRACALAVLCVTLAVPATALASSPPGPVTTTPAMTLAAPGGVVTCGRAIDYVGTLRADPDQFADMAGQSCISVSGDTLTILDNSRWQGSVVKYPAWRYGPYFHSGDTGSVLPERVTRTQGLVFHLGATGHAEGTWLTDSDIWLFSSDKVTGHGTAEIVVGLRYTAWSPGPGYRLISAGGYRYWAGVHTTCNSGKCWPLIVLRAFTQARHRALTLSTLLYHLRKLGWVHRSQWVGSVAFGSECWSGCKGLSDSMTVSGVITQ